MATSFGPSIAKPQQLKFAMRDSGASKRSHLAENVSESPASAVPSKAVSNTLGTPGPDILNGTSGSDLLFGYAGKDVLNGEGGVDILAGGEGGDVLNGGADTDYAYYGAAFAPVTVNLKKPSQNKGEAKGDSYISIEGVFGSDFADKLTGDDNPNAIYGVSGNDFIFGLGGSDNLYGDLGNDVIEGGAGGDVIDGGADFDFASYANATGSVRVGLSANSNEMTGDARGDIFVSIQGIVGSKFNDFLAAAATIGTTLIGGAGDDSLIGGSGGDILEGGSGKDDLRGNGGFDSATYGLAKKAVTVNLANSALNKGEAAGDTFLSIEGLGGSNFKDKLTGDAVGNIINGGLGSDTLTGGGGADAFVFSTTLHKTKNVDSITDYETETDAIWLENTGVFSSLTTAGQLNAANFQYNKALDSNDFIIYDVASGDIFYDADGSGGGAAIKFAHVKFATFITAADFLII
jgi:serralysin